METSVETASTIDALRELLIGTPTCKKLQADLTRLFRAGPDGTPTHQPVLFTAGTETHGMILVAGPGAGKTTAIRRAVSEIKALAENPQTGLPRYIHVTVASPATLRSLGCQFLEKLGVDRISDRTKVHDIWLMVRHRLRLLGISLVAVDEAHDMFRSTSTSETDTMFRMMKSLMQGDHPVVLLLGGTERLLDITRLDAQVNRRFLKVVAAPLDIVADGQSIREIIGFYAKKAGLQLDIHDDLPGRVIHGARYQFGRCVELTLAAIEEALRAGDEHLTREHFEIAWGMAEGCPLTANVFDVEDYMSIELEDDDLIGERLQEARVNKARAAVATRSKRGRRAA